MDVVCHAALAGCRSAALPIREPRPLPRGDEGRTGVDRPKSHRRARGLPFFQLACSLRAKGAGEPMLISAPRLAALSWATLTAARGRTSARNGGDVLDRERLRGAAELSASPAAISSASACASAPVRLRTWTRAKQRPGRISASSRSPTFGRLVEKRSCGPASALRRRRW